MNCDVIELAQHDKLTQPRLKQFSSDKEVHVVQTRPRHKNRSSRKQVSGNSGDSHSREDKPMDISVKSAKSTITSLTFVAAILIQHIKHVLPHSNVPHKHVYEYDVVETNSNGNDE